MSSCLGYFCFREGITQVFIKTYYIKTDLVKHLYKHQSSTGIILCEVISSRNCQKCLVQVDEKPLITIVHKVNWCTIYEGNQTSRDIVVSEVLPVK